MRNRGSFGIILTGAILLALGPGLAQKTFAEEKSKMLRKQVLMAAFALFLLTAMLMPWEAFGQADSLEVEVIWQKELDSKIGVRQNIVGSVSDLEPDVGIDLTAPEGSNPVRAVKTHSSIYIFNEKGEVKKRIPLKRDPVSNDYEAEKNREHIAQYGRVSPNGKFYVIFTSISTGPEGTSYTALQVFDVDGGLKFELKKEDLSSEGLGIGIPYIPPSGGFIVLFNELPWEDRWADFYSLDGHLRKHIDFSAPESDLYPVGMGFSESGNKVVFTNYKIQAMYDAWGKKLDRVKVVEEKARKADKVLALSIKQKLEAKLPARPLSKLEKSRARYGSIRRNETVKLYPERGLGIYNRGKTLYLFSLNKKNKRGEGGTMGYQKSPTGTVRIWDTNKKYLHFYVGFVAWEDRAMWTQVPYGKTDYEFKGEAVMENNHMFLFLHSGRQSGPILYAKLGKKNPDAKRWGHEHSIHNALYRVWWEDGGEVHHYDGQPWEGTRENRIEKNEEGEAVIVNIAGRDMMNAGRYRLLAGKHWLEVSPVEGKKADEMGYHGEARVMLVPDYEDGNDWSIQPDKERIDYVFDSAEDRYETYGRSGSPDQPVHPTRRDDTASAAKDKPEWGSYPMTPPGSKMLIDLQMTGGQFMWTMAYRSWEVAKPYLNWAPGGRLDKWPPWRNGALKRREDAGVWSAPYGCFGGEKIVVGVVNSPGSWHPEVVGMPLKDGKVDGKPVEAGEEYTTEWKVPYSGLWRMTARFWDGEKPGKGRYYSQQVEVSVDSALTFTCPISGKLEYIILYLYDRTEKTPLEVGTPMDIYREAIEGK